MSPRRSVSLRRASAGGLTGDSIAWQARLERDRAAALRNQSDTQRVITETLLERAIEAGARAFALTGSTARDRRTQISDLDYHVIGERPNAQDLHDEIDIVAYDHLTLTRKLRAGDDYAQWTLRFGCILYDDGTFREAAGLIEREGIWPDPTDKLARLPGHVELVRRLVDLGDRDAAQAEARAMLTSLARAVLLSGHDFPLARSELARQLRDAGASELGDHLEILIYREPSLDALAETVDVALRAASALPSVSAPAA